jgi:hypothetical protein
LPLISAEEVVKLFEEYQSEEEAGGAVGIRA